MTVGSAIVSAFLWLADKVGSKQLDKLLESEPDRTRAMLEWALLESQDRRLELEGVADLLARMQAQRDALTDRVVQLTAERSILMARIADLERRLIAE